MLSGSPCSVLLVTYRAVSKGVREGERGVSLEAEFNGLEEMGRSWCI